MILNVFTFLTISLLEFLTASIESVLVFYTLNILYKNVHLSNNAMTDITDECEDVQEHEDILSLPSTALVEMSQVLLLTDDDKTKRIEELEVEVASLTCQLTEARNLVNTLYTEIDRYKRVNSQVGWLVEKVRHDMSDMDLKRSRLPLPPPLPPAEDTDSKATKTNDLADDEYSDDWETSDEAEDHTPSNNILYQVAIPRETQDRHPIIGPHAPRALSSPDPVNLCKTSIKNSLSSDTRRVPRDPTPVPMPPNSEDDARVDALLAVATPQTRISEIFRRWFPSTSGPPPPPS